MFKKINIIGDIISQNNLQTRHIYHRFLGSQTTTINPSWSSILFMYSSDYQIKKNFQDLRRNLFRTLEKSNKYLIATCFHFPDSHSILDLIALFPPSLFPPHILIGIIPPLKAYNNLVNINKFELSHFLILLPVSFLHLSSYQLS